LMERLKKEAFHRGIERRSECTRWRRRGHRRPQKRNRVAPERQGPSNPSKGQCIKVKVGVDKDWCRKSLRRINILTLVGQNSKRWIRLKNLNMMDMKEKPGEKLAPRAQRKKEQERKRCYGCRRGLGTTTPQNKGKREENRRKENQ